MFCENTVSGHGVTDLNRKRSFHFEFLLIQSNSRKSLCFFSLWFLLTRRSYVVARPMGSCAACIVSLLFRNLFEVKEKGGGESVINLYLGESVNYLKWSV